jgi:hypothetical protein
MTQETKKDRACPHCGLSRDAHDDLVEALTWAMMQIPGYTQRIPKQNEDWCDAYDAAKAALAKAAS